MMRSHVSLHLAALALVLASLVSAGQTAAVHASTNRTTTKLKYSVTVLNTHKKYCAGIDYELAVIVSSYERAVDENGVFIAEINKRGARAEITASMTDSSIAAIKNSTANTAPDVANGGDGEAAISFHANKSGSTSLKIQVKPDDGQDVPDTFETINVENCPYKVYMNVFGVFLGGGINIWTAGRMETKISDENGQMTGTGTLKFTSGASLQDCSDNYSLYDIPTQIQGPGIENDELKLNFSLGSGDIQYSWTCPDASRSGSKTIDLTGLGMPVFTFPAEGGIDTFVTDYKDLHVTMIITVVPDK